MKKTKLTLISFIYSAILIFSSCGPKNIEEQVKQLIESDDVEERTEIANALADSLDIKASKLLFDVYSTDSSNKYVVTKALEKMLSRYSKLKDKKLDECVSYITDPNPQHSITNKEKINFIIHGLEITKSRPADIQLYPCCATKQFTETIAKSALRHGNYAMIEIINQWSQNKSSKELLYAINLFSDEAIDYLSDKIVEDENAVDLLAQIGKPAVNSMKEKMRSNNQSVRFAAGDVLVKMLKYHPKAIESLTSAIDKNGLRTIARNYPFYIRLGQSGTEKILLKALRQNFSTTMCVDYLNCGSTILEDGATKIARINGYNVTSGFGGHSGPRWGSGN